jgi:transposase
MFKLFKASLFIAAPTDPKYSPYEYVKDILSNRWKKLYHSNAFFKQKYGKRSNMLLLDWLFLAFN